jgi:hypothetical protein
MDADTVESGPKGRVTHVEDAPAGWGGSAIEPVDPRAGRLDPPAEAKPAQDGKAGRLEEKPGADRLRLVEPLEDADSKPGTIKEEGGRHSRRPAADDGDLAKAGHGRDSSWHGTGPPEVGNIRSQARKGGANPCRGGEGSGAEDFIPWR